VASGVEAVQMAERIGYDVIFMDCQMPDMDGYEATRLIRAGTRNPNTPIIALTANVLPADRAACLAVGMNDHIGKPVTRDMLRLALKTWGLTRSALNSGEGMPATSGEGDPVGAFDAP
jgi:CheY-like chemotaxis protein